MAKKKPPLAQSIENLITVLRGLIRQAGTLGIRNDLNEEIETRRLAAWHCTQNGDDLNEHMERVLQEFMKRVLVKLTVEQRRAKDLENRRALPPGKSKGELRG